MGDNHPPAAGIGMYMYEYTYTACVVYVYSVHAEDRFIRGRINTEEKAKVVAVG